MKSWLPIAALLLVLPAAADVVHLQDGTKLDGTIQREQGGWAVTDKSGKVAHVTDDKVQSIEKTGSARPADAADAKLNVLRRAVDNLSDVGPIIDRYTRFIEQNKNTPAAAAAQKDLEVWNDRQTKGLVKAGNSWITPREQAELLSKTAAVSEEARALVKDGRYKEADAAINKLLAADPNSPSALYLRGVVMVKLDQLGQAKKSFERVRELVADHGPTFNNLGVIACQQKQLPLALSLYDQAMVASPRNRRILDNVAEALAMVPPSQKDTTLGKRVIKRFQEQDAELAWQLAQEGLERWGAIYLTKEQKAEVKKVQAKVDLLAEDYQKMKSRIQDIEMRIDTNDRQLRQIDADRTIRDVNGNITWLSPPRIWYDLRRENDTLQSERVRLIETLDTFPQKERAIWQESPIKPFTGVFRIIEAEGTPLVPAKAAGPSTQPSTMPTKGSGFGVQGSVPQFLNPEPRTLA